MSEIAAADLSPGARMMLEGIAEHLDLGVGSTRLESVFEDGELRYIYRHERVDAADVDERFPVRESRSQTW